MVKRNVSGSCSINWTYMRVGVGEKIFETLVEGSSHSRDGCGFGIKYSWHYHNCAINHGTSIKWEWSVVHWIRCLTCTKKGSIPVTSLIRVPLGVSWPELFPNCHACSVVFSACVVGDHWLGDMLGLVGVVNSPTLTCFRRVFWVGWSQHLQ